MRYNYPYVKSRAVTREVVNDFFRFRRQGCPKGHITRATSHGQPTSQGLHHKGHITRAAVVLFNDLFMIRATPSFSSIICS